MQRKLERLQQATMTLCRKLQNVSFLVLLSCANAAPINEQTATQDGNAVCLTIHVRLNGKLVAGPQVITLKSRNEENRIPLQGGCFNVPPAFLKEKTMDVSFALPRDKVYLSAIATGFVKGPWDVDLADRGFRPDVVLPKSARARETCVVAFHVGEPETIQAFTGCRTPLPRVVQP